jgi:predicted nucleic acid-binding Zn ribbon protein
MKACVIMANNTNQKKKTGLNREQKRQRTQKVIFSIIALIIIASWILMLIVKI